MLGVYKNISMPTASQCLLPGSALSAMKAITLALLLKALYPDGRKLTVYLLPPDISDPYQEISIKRWVGD